MELTQAITDSEEVFQRKANEGCTWCQYFPLLMHVYLKNIFLLDYKSEMIVFFSDNNTECNASRV